MAAWTAAVMPGWSAASTAAAKSSCERGAAAERNCSTLAGDTAWLGCWYAIGSGL